MATKNRIRCNQCEALMINGLFCHETGCPNTKARYEPVSGEWIETRKCFECGFTVDADNPCCSEQADDAEQGSTLTPVVAILTIFVMAALLIAQSGIVNALVARFAQVSR